MNICFIAEGSYPYMIGGISSWLDIFLKCFPDDRFTTLAIAAKEQSKGIFRCKIPHNMTGIHEVFLDTPFLVKRGRPLNQIRLSAGEQEMLLDHISARYSDWGAIFEFIQKIRHEKLLDFFNSHAFFDILRTFYNQSFSHAPFINFLWTIRNMYIYQFHLLQVEVPEADLYHAVSAGYPGIIGAREAYLRGKPFILTEHGIYTREREEEILKNNELQGDIKNLWVRYFQSMSGCAYQYADRIITQFERNRSYQLESGADKSKTLIIRNGMEVAKDTSERHGRLYGEGVVLGAIARIVPIKDILTMLKGFGAAKRTMPELRLVIVGPVDEDKEYFRQVTGYIAANGIRDVVFTGRVDTVHYHGILASVDVLLLTSISEGQPMSILEGMAASKPFIATDVGSCKEMLEGPDEDGPSGVVIPVMDHLALSAAILRLASDADLRKTMGQAGFSRVNKLYSTGCMRDGYRRVYEEAVLGR